MLFVVHKANGTDDISLDALRKLLLAEKTFWKEGGHVKLYTPQAEKSRAREVVLERICRMDEKKYRKYWQLRVFKGEVASAPSERTEEQLARDVAGDEAALGYISSAVFDKLPQELKDRLKMLRVDGKAPADKDYALSIPAVP